MSAKNKKPLFKRRNVFSGNAFCISDSVTLRGTVGLIQFPAPLRNRQQGICWGRNLGNGAFEMLLLFAPRAICLPLGTLLVFALTLGALGAPICCRTSGNLSSFLRERRKFFATLKSFFSPLARSAQLLSPRPYYIHVHVLKTNTIQQPWLAPYY